MIQVILYLLLAANLIEDTVSATFHDFMKHFPEKMADAFKSSWRVITQGSSELKRTSPPRGLTEGPLWIKIPKMSPKINNKKHRTDGRRINQEPETKLRIPFFTPPKPNYKYLMRTVLWRTPRDAEIERMVDTKRMAGAVNLSVPTVMDASTATTRVAYTLVTMETTTHMKNHTMPEIRFFFKRFRFHVFNKLEVN
ncbi:uncharacterized protein LOC113233795 isoform X3 [Hyposmocoma kahamanoa]|uniref:uncharacterized protein LOC113233795 isoform X3 n=1 Tax=Hyposmocoma kahamanoa TaxID=1477025 RepID=UPI000E6D7BA4|nr:uncharacterized protein LOC113233795 isoform X3 [Hyposmocoma kahamanoa]